jgi:hypothetical protein
MNLIENVLFQEMLSRYDQFVKEHAEFDNSYSDFLEWLKLNQENLAVHSEIVGDLSVLQVIIKKRKYSNKWLVF